MNSISIFISLIWIILPVFGSSQSNVIVFVSDEISWNNYCWYRNKIIKTSNFDVLVKNGLPLEIHFKNSKDDVQLINIACKPEYRCTEKHSKKVLATWVIDTGDAYAEYVNYNNFDHLKDRVVKGFDDSEVTWS